MKKRLMINFGMWVLIILSCYYFGSNVMSLNNIEKEKFEILYLIKYFYEDEKDPVKARAKIISEGTTIGFFTQIYWGDYAHFSIKDINGKEDSFFISEKLNTDTFFEEFMKDERNVGMKVKIIWHEVDIFIPEADGNQKLIVMVDYELL